MRERVEAVAAELMKDEVQIEPGKAKLLHTRRAVERGWRAVSDLLAGQGQGELATRVRLFLDRMPPPLTEKEHLLAGLRERIDMARRPHHGGTRDPRLERTR